MSEDIQTALQAFAKGFVDEVKGKLDGQWKGYNAQTKADIEATAKLAAEVAFDLSLGREVDPVKHRHLVLQVKQIKVIGAIQIRHAIDEILEVAAKVGKTALKFAIEMGVKAVISELK